MSSAPPGPRPVLRDGLWQEHGTVLEIWGKSIYVYAYTCLDVYIYVYSFVYIYIYIYIIQYVHVYMGLQKRVAEKALLGILESVSVAILAQGMQ